MQIRQATIGDLVTVYELLDALRKESIWGTIPVEPIQPYVHSQLITMLHDRKHRLVVAESDGAILGIGGAELASHRFLPGLIYLQEWALYVKPVYRQMGVGKALWKYLLAWGKQRGAFGAVYGKPRMTQRGRMVEEVRWQVFEEALAHA